MVNKKDTRMRINYLDESTPQKNFCKNQNSIWADSNSVRYSIEKSLRNHQLIWIDLVWRRQVSVKLKFSPYFGKKVMSVKYVRIWKKNRYNPVHFQQIFNRVLNGVGEKRLILFACGKVILISISWSWVGVC